MDSVLKIVDIKAEISMGLRDPFQRRTGKTYGMCQDIVAEIKERRDIKILVLGIDMRHCQRLKDTLISVLDDQRIEYHLLSSSTISGLPFGWSVVFDFPNNIHIYAGLYPGPFRFVDHFTEERIISDALDSLLRHLSVLKKGH